MNTVINTNEYWQRVHDVAETLPKDAIYLMSIEIPYNHEHKAGRMSLLGPQHRIQAGEFIVNRLHRLATKEEIAAWEADQDAKRELAKQAAIDAKGIHIHPVMASAPTQADPKKSK